MDKLYQENEELEDLRENTEATTNFAEAHKIGQDALKDSLLFQNRTRDP